MVFDERQRRPFRASFLISALITLTVLPFMGCPAPTPKLAVSPTALTMGSSTARTSFVIRNSGSGALTWTAEEVLWSDEQMAWVEGDCPWLEIDAADLSGTVTTASYRVHVDADRTSLPVGTQTGAGVRVTTNYGVMVVPIGVVVADGGTTEPGEGNLQADTDSLTIQGLADTATFTVQNTGSAFSQWYINIVVNQQGAGEEAPIQIATSPAQAVTSAGGSTTVTVSIPNPDDFDTNYLNYTIQIRNAGSNTLADSVNVTVDLVGPAAVSVSPGTLDFGENGYQLSFLVANTGDLYSMLDFAIFRKTGDSTYSPFEVAQDALIAAVSAPKGMNNLPHLFEDDLGNWLNAREVSVTISRDGIENDLEIRDLWIGAVRAWDSQGKPIIDPDVAPARVQVRVAAAPYVEGATNRARPPYLVRFVFLLRDKRGVAINAADPLVSSQIDFAIKEDDIPIENIETGIYVTGPESLKTNVVVLLDFTASMYMAGVDDPVNPLQPGDAMKQMVQAAKQFILDLPDTYRIAIMEYHDRDQSSRLIHGFDTDKEDLAEALDSFTMPSAEHGASEILDAVKEACNLLENEDASVVLPFDEADVRSVVFITDGHDTSSLAKLADVTGTAKDARVRLYPIGFSGRYSNPVNTEALIPLAAETGGHAFYAPQVSDLTRLLDTQEGLFFGKPVYSLQNRRATIPFQNNTPSSFAWQITSSEDWLSVSPSSGTIPPLFRSQDGTIVEPGLRNIVLTVDAGLPEGTLEGTVVVHSQQGDATIAVRAEIDTDGDLTRLVVLPRTDENGRIWGELQGQVVLTYSSLVDGSSHTYNITSTFPDSEGNMTSAWFEKDGFFYTGDTRAGQVSLMSDGLQSDGSAEIQVRLDYAPRNITQFEFRFTPYVSEILSPNLDGAQRAILLSSLTTQLNDGAVSIASDSPVAGWRLLNKGNGIFDILTEPGDNLPFAAFGTLLKIKFENLLPNGGLPKDTRFGLRMQMNNSLYSSPGSGGQSSFTKYFLFPGCLLNPGAFLTIEENANLAPPVVDLGAFNTQVNPDQAGIWDRDGDGWDDFDDSDPDNPNVGDADDDGMNDLDDPAPLDPSIP